MAELQAKYPGGVDVELIKGDRGAFEVKLGGELIYSKFSTGRFPLYAEIPALINERQ